MIVPPLISLRTLLRRVRDDHVHDERRVEESCLISEAGQSAMVVGMSNRTVLPACELCAGEVPGVDIFSFRSRCIF